SRYFSTVPKVCLYALYVLWELVVSSLRVAWVVVSPSKSMKPGIVAVPLRLKHDYSIFVLANSITLTPGTLSLSVSKDKRTLFVHGMFIGDLDEFRKSIQNGFEKKIMEFME
ncbi:MAG TPA: Na+/H+ antiporter subunit E, partial [Candidatus Omnitrophota bacterium]|nr:Na+/H+ antiporter subunit E [Candidatus Omnitrophota bacterium]